MVEAGAAACAPQRCRSRVGPLEGRHSPPSGRLRAARRPSRPHSGPLRAFRTKRCTPGYPPETREVPVNAVPQRRGLRRGPHAGPPLDHQSKVYGLGRRVAVPRRAPLCLPQAAGRVRGRERQHARRNGDDPGVGPLEGRHSPPSGRLRAARRPSRPHSGPLRAFRTQRCTPGYPRKPVRCPSTPFPSAAASAAVRHDARVPPRTSIRGGRSVGDVAAPSAAPRRLHRDPSTVASALRFTYRLLQAQRSLSTRSNPQQLPVLRPLAGLSPHPGISLGRQQRAS